MERNVFSGEHTGRKCKGFFSLYSIKQLYQVLHLTADKSMSSQNWDSTVRKQDDYNSNGEPMAIVTPTYITLKGSRTCHPKICHLRTLITLRWGHLKDSKCSQKLSLNAPYLSKDRSSKRNTVVINPLPGNFIHDRRVTFVTGEKTKSHHHTPDKLCHKLSYFAFFKRNFKNWF